MPGRTGLVNTSVRLTTGYLDTQMDPSPGVPLASPSGSIVQPYFGQVGQILELSADDAAKVTSSGAAFTLKGGIYQYVKFTSTAASLANSGAGRLLFWDTSVAEDLYQVCQLESTNGSVPLLAGVMLSSAAVAGTGGYGWMQIAGRTALLCRATVTNATRYLFWSKAGVGADNATVDGGAATSALQVDSAVATTVSSGFNEFIGLGEAVAANATLITTNISPKAFYPRY